MFDFNPAYQSQGYTNQKLWKIPYLVQWKSEMPKKYESYAEAHTVRATLRAWIIINNLTPRKKEC